MATPRKQFRADPATKMTPREAGRKGGETVRNKYGSAYFKAIGRKGGLVSQSKPHDDAPTQSDFSVCQYLYSDGKRCGMNKDAHKGTIHAFRQ